MQYHRYALSQVSVKAGHVKSNADTLSTKRRAIAAYALIGTMKAEFLSLRQLRKVRLTRTELKFISELKHLAHDNLTRFLGICYNDSDRFYILQGLIERASLEVSAYYV